MSFKWSRMAVYFVVLSVLPACAHVRDDTLSPKSTVVGREHHEATLRALVDRSLGDAQKVNTPATARTTFARPYYFREYSIYPKGIESYGLEMRESDSQSTPYTARIRLPQLRYTTSFEKKKSVARGESVYREASGIETRSYELRHGHWRETGSVFVAHASELVPAEMVIAPEEVDEDSGSGVVKRLFFWRQ